jgi:hypothetical protein
LKIEVVVEDVIVNFIDLENLKKNKKASGRLQDLAERHLVAGRARSSLGVVSNEEALKRANGELGEDALELQRV